MKIGRRTLTNTKSSRQMTFDRDCLDEIGFNAGVYVVMYEKNKITIVKENLIKDIITEDIIDDDEEENNEIKSVDYSDSWFISDKEKRC